MIDLMYNMYNWMIASPACSGGVRHTREHIGFMRSFPHNPALHRHEALDLIDQH